MNAQELVHYIFEQKHEALSAACLHGFQTCPRFKVFAEEYRNKMRRKVRGSRDPDTLSAVWSEFAVAWWLLQEQRFEALYEPCLKDKRRGPDFTVHFKTHVVFHVEVTRVCSPGESGQKLAKIVCGKLFQMPVSAINLLVIVMDHAIPQEAVFTDLLKRADCKDEAYFRLLGFDGSKEFWQYCNRLSGVLVRTQREGAEPSRLLWLNGRAIHRVPEDLRRILEGLPFADSA